MITRRLLARNTMLNLVAQVLPLLIALAAFRPLTQALGTSRFGVLSLAWTLIGYFSLFDLGMGRALTQAASEALGRGDRERLSRLGSTGVVVLFVFGIIGGLLVAALTPLLVNRFLRMEPGLRPEAAHAFYLLAASLPFVLSTLGIRALLEAHQHFGLATALRLPYAAFNFLGPLLVLPFSQNLVVIVGALVFGRVATWVAHLIFGFRRYPWLRQSSIGSLTLLAPVIRTGGWMTVSNIVSPLMVNLDRFLIGAFLSMAAVAYYVTPFEVVTRLLFIPGAVLGVFFPVFATTFVQDRERTARIMDRVIRLLLLLIFPIILLIAAFASEGLLVWMGPEYARESATVLQVLAVGVLINSVGQVPFALLQATGRADLTAKLHVAEFPLYVVMIYAMAQSFGLAGVAMAWTARIMVDTGVLLWLSRRQLSEAGENISQAVLWLGLLVTTVVGVSSIPGFIPRLIIALSAVVLFWTHAWRRILRPAERVALVELITNPRAILTPV